MAPTTYIETSQLLALGLSNPSETRTTPSTALFRSPVAFFSPNSRVFTGSVTIVVESILQKFEAHGRKKTLRSEAFLSATSVSVDSFEHFFTTSEYFSVL